MYIILQYIKQNNISNKWEIMKTLLKTIVFLCLIFSADTLLASDQQDAIQKIKEAISLMEQGDFDDAEKLLEEAADLDEDNYMAVYELGYLYLLKKDYDTAEDHFEDLVEMDNITPQCWQMLGNVYDMNGKHEDALETYKKGLEEFPESGALYYELGVVSKDSIELALQYFEKGVEVQPEYPTNYFALTNFFLSTEQEIWGMIYGEIFINLTIGSEKANSVGIQLYNTYQSEIEHKDSTVSVSFFNANNLKGVLSNLMGKDYFPAVYEMNLSIASAFNLSKDGLDLPSLIKLRTDFINNYYNNKFDEKYANILFDWHKKLIDADMFEVYNYLIFVSADPVVAQTWLSNNQSKVQEFITWLKSNRFPISKENLFLRKNNI